jgi:hypothetical protein
MITYSFRIKQQCPKLFNDIVLSVRALKIGVMKLKVLRKGVIFTLYYYIEMLSKILFVVGIHTCFFKI